MDPLSDPITGRVIILPGITVPIFIFLIIVFAVYYSCKKQRKEWLSSKGQEKVCDGENEEETELMGQKSDETESTKPIIVATYRKRGSEGFEQVSINITPAEKTDSESENENEEQHHRHESQQISQSVDED